jgi:hypothetical protein
MAAICSTYFENRIDRTRSGLFAGADGDDIGALSGKPHTPLPRNAGCIYGAVAHLNTQACSASGCTLGEHSCH